MFKRFFDSSYSNDYKLSVIKLYWSLIVSKKAYYKLQTVIDLELLISSIDLEDIDDVGWVLETSGNYCRSESFPS